MAALKQHCIAADIGGTNIRVSVVSSDGRVVKKIKEPSGADPFPLLLEVLDALVADSRDGIVPKGIGIAVAGVVDTGAGVVLRSPNLAGIVGKPIKQELSQRFGLPVLVLNDANAAAFGEKVAGNGKAYDDFVVFTLGTGIGGGVVQGGRLLSIAAELGHTTINPSGPACACGNAGCLESYASATAIIGNAVAAVEKGTESNLKMLHNGNIYKISAEDIYRSALDGDPLARSVLRDAGKALGIGIANAVNVFSPQAIILAGGLIGAWNIYVEAALTETSKRALPELLSSVTILPSSLGDDAGTIGMASLVFDAAASGPASAPAPQRKTKGTR